MRAQAGSADTREAAVVWALRLRGGLLTDADAEGLGTTPDVKPQSEQQPVSRRGFLSMALAAGLAAVGGGLLYLSGRHRYKTDVGEMGHVLLPDGSLAILNTATEIELGFTESDRSGRSPRKFFCSNFVSQPWLFSGSAMPSWTGVKVSTSIARPSLDQETAI